MTKVAEVIQAIENLAPSASAEAWDNVGLLAGDPEWKTRGAVICVDLIPRAIQVARAKGYRLIVNHHPCIFPGTKGLNRIVPSTGSPGSTASLVFECIRQGIAVAAYHTNFDRCALEVTQAVSRGLGLRPRGRLHDKKTGLLVKLVVFVPLTHVDQVRAALCDAGAGNIGNYDFCTFGSEGEGTFRGGEGTQPFLGRPGQLERAREVRLETVFPKGLEKIVLEALRRAHPYEEIAYDLYSVEQPLGAEGLVKGSGYGFWGDFDQTKPFSEVSRRVKEVFGIGGFYLTDPAPKRIKRIGFVAGKGASFAAAAASVGCDLFITGEAGYHVALDGVRREISIMEIGHRESELFFPRIMDGWLKRLSLATTIVSVPTQKIW